MKRRWKIITAIILSTAMTAMSLSPGFASEAVSEKTVELTSEEIDAVEAEGLTEESASGSVNTADQTGLGESEDEDTQNAGPGNSEDKEQDTDKAEITENSVPAASDASGEDTFDEVTGDEVMTVAGDTSVTPKLSVRYSYSDIYNGKVFSPGTFKLSKGSKILDAPNITKGKEIKGASESDVDYVLPGITNVNQSYVYYVYPKNATNDSDYTETIEVSVTTRPVTFRSKTYCKEYDGKPLSQNVASEEDLPKVVRGSMVDGQKVTFSFNGVNNGDPDKDTSVKNTYRVLSNNTVNLDNYDFICEYGDLIITASRNSVPNDLDKPLKAKAVINKNGSVKVSWKKVKSYKDNGKKGGKTTYKVYRYRENGIWGEPIATDLKKTSFVDSEALTGERLIYKIVPCGIDGSGVRGEGREPAYVRVTPKIVSVSPYEGTKYANVRFIGMGSDTDSYTLEHWNNKKKNTRDSIKVTKYNSTIEDYKYTKRTVSLNSFLDAGGDNVSISGNNTATFSFRIKAEEAEVYDYGKAVTVEESPWSKTEKLKMVSMVPVLKGKRTSNTSFELKWNKIGKANGYLIEYSKDKDFSAADGNDTHRIYVSKSEKSSTYNNRKYEVKDVGFGIPYYCKVTAYKKDKGDATEYGAVLGTSDVIIQYGRQKKVSEFKAQYFEDGNYKCDAKLTWEDDEDGIWGYYVQRWSYAYNEDSKAYDKQTGYEVLQDYHLENSKKKYVNGVGGKVVNGELIKYRVQSVKKPGGTVGENLDGFVFSEPSDYYFMNPTEVSFTKSKYTVKVDETLKPSIKFKPKKLPKKADGLTQSEFKEIFCFNDEVEYVLQSDDLTASQIKKYVTLDKSSGKLKGISAYKKDYIKLKVSSPNDKEIYDTAIIYVEKSEESSSDEKSGDLSDLKICVDAGHGGSDDGATGNGLVEKEVNLKIAKKVGKYLENKGAKVIYTRTDDNFLELTKRTDIAKEKNCNLFISMHCNSGDSSASGTEVYYSVKDKYARPKLAKHISSAVANAFGINNRGAKTRTGSDGDYYSVIRTSAEKGIPGLIVEHAFISNSSDAGKLKDDDAISKAAKAEADAIEDYWDQ